jgi:peptidoglycan LD-endopeptidase CwlK
MRQFSKRSLDNMRGIHPDLRRVMDRALQESPVDFTVIEGLRTKERQAQLVASGASRTMNSRHITGHAVDLLPIDPATGRGEFAWPLYHKLAPAVKAAAAAEGVAIKWGGDWKSFKDGPHFELDRATYPETDWVSIEPKPKERTTPAQSTTLQATAATAAAGATGVATAIGQLDGMAQIAVIAAAAVAVLALAWIARERLRKWAEGDR